MCARVLVVCTADWQSWFVSVGGYVLQVAPMVWMARAPIIITSVSANVTTNTKNCDLPPTLATQPNQAKSKDAKIKLEPTVATGGCVDGSTPMIWYGRGLRRYRHKVVYYMYSATDYICVYTCACARVCVCVRARGGGGCCGRFLLGAVMYMHSSCPLPDTARNGRPVYSVQCRCFLPTGVRSSPSPSRCSCSGCPPVCRQCG